MEVVGNMILSKVIAVDLDGTLTSTDTLYEGVLALVRIKPFMLFLLPFWLIKGVAHLKSKVAENSVLDVTTLPYNLPFIDWLKKEKATGKKIVLCTAANKRVALAVSEHFKIFDDVIASNETINVKGTNKRILLDKKFGKRGYDYAGNSGVDLKVWAGARKAIVVNASRNVYLKAKKTATVSKTFSPQDITISSWFKMLRVHHWLKNMLLFVPLLTAHQFNNIQHLSTLTLSFISFSLCASSVYIINDLLDLESDRRHTQKRNRPFASGKIPIKIGLILFPQLVFISLILAWTIGLVFFVLLILYIFLSIIYSFLIKKIIILDCLALAILFTLRIFAGASVVSIKISFWLFIFSVFIFLSLAFVKRYVEIHNQKKHSKIFLHGRGYLATDAPLIQTLGIASGYSGMVVFALYLSSEKVITLYSQPELLWFALLLLIFWINWIWIKAHRGEVHDDPIMFAIQDKISLLVISLIFIVFTMASGYFYIQN